MKKYFFMKRAIMLTETDVHNIIKGFLIEAYSGLIDNDQNQDELHRVACQKGFNLIGYHNTREQFLTNFYDRSAGIHFGSLKAANDRGEHRDWDDDVQNWTNEYFLKVKNPLVIEKDFDWEMESFDYWSSPDDDEYYDDIDIFVYFDRVLGFDIEGKDIKEIINEHGYDCIIYRNEREDVGNYSIAMFNPNHIKLARQTYDDNNNPIPLEQRFNTNTDDVRY